MALLILVISEGFLQVYQGMMDLCVSKFREGEGLYVGPKEAGYCLLRSQLLMAFHDNPSFRHLANEVGKKGDRIEDCAPIGVIVEASTPRMSLCQ